MKTILLLLTFALTGCRHLSGLNATVSTGKGGQRIYGVGVDFRPVERRPSK